MPSRQRHGWDAPQGEAVHVTLALKQELIVKASAAVSNFEIVDRPSITRLRGEGEALEFRLE